MLVCHKLTNILIIGTLSLNNIASNTMLIYKREKKEFFAVETLLQFIKARAKAIWLQNKTVCFDWIVHGSIVSYLVNYDDLECCISSCYDTYVW